MFRIRDMVSTEYRELLDGAVLAQCYPPQPSASTDNSDLGRDNYWHHAQLHPITAYYVFVKWCPEARDIISAEYREFFDGAV